MCKYNVNILIKDKYNNLVDENLPLFVNDDLFVPKVYFNIPVSSLGTLDDNCQFVIYIVNKDENQYKEIAHIDLDILAKNSKGEIADNINIVCNNMSFLSEGIHEILVYIDDKEILEKNKYSLSYLKDDKEKLCARSLFMVKRNAT